MSKDHEDDKVSATARPLGSVVSPADLPEAWPQVHPLETDLGKERFAAIGEILVLWAHAVWHLEGIVCRILDIGRKEARIAAAERDLPVGKSIDRVRDLMKAAYREPPDIRALKSLLVRCEANRNLIAHGVWLKHSVSEKVGIQDTRDVWELPDEQGKYKKNDKYPKRVDPQLRFLEEEGFFDSTKADIKAAIEGLRKLDGEVRERLAEVDLNKLADLIRPEGI